MPSDLDVRRARRAVRLMRANGLRVVEVDGWEVRGRPGPFGPLVSVMEHHDASTPKAGNWGALGVITAGRAGIPGPLAAWQVARDGTWALVAAGRNNGSGAGGPLRLLRALVERDRANAECWNVEVANDGSREAYGEALHRSLDVGLACLLRAIDEEADALVGHREWAAAALDTAARFVTGRKPDPRHRMTWRRERVARALRGLRDPDTPTPTPTPKPVPEDDMPTAAEIWGHRIKDKNFEGPASAALTSTYREAQWARLRVAAVGKALAALSEVVAAVAAGQQVAQADLDAIQELVSGSEEQPAEESAG